MCEWRPDALDGGRVGVEHFAVSQFRRVSILVLQQLHPLGKFLPGMVATAFPVPIAVHWKLYIVKCIVLWQSGLTVFGYDDSRPVSPGLYVDHDAGILTGKVDQVVLQEVSAKHKY